MSYSTKVDSLTKLIIDSALAELKPRFDDAVAIAGEYRYFADDRPFLAWIQEISKEHSGFIDAVTSTAAVAELLDLVKKSILADDQVDAQELSVSMDLLKGVIRHYAWLPQYKRFEPLVDPSEVRDLLSVWEDDGGFLGGDFKGKAVVQPFATLVMLACILKGDSTLHDTFSQVTLLIVKMVLSAGGIDEEERKLLERVQETRGTERKLIDAVIESRKLPSGGGGTQPEAGSSSDIQVEAITPASALADSLKELACLVGVPEVKAEIRKLTNFLKVRQQRLAAGLPLPNQSLHFVFTGNPGTGKTTVARIISRIFYGFELLKTPTLVEADRSALVGGYLGQTAIKTNEVIEKAINGVLFLDEAYTLTPKTSHGDQFGQEAIDTLLKRMEDLRDRLVVIVAGYPQLMREFLSANPGLESRFTRFIHFDDYHVSDLCNIFERMCTANSYNLTQQARGNLSILFNRAYVKKDEKFGNARFVRNAYERTLGNHADRLASIDDEISTDMLSTIEAEDLPFHMVVGLPSAVELSGSKWSVKCPGCEKLYGVGIELIGNRLTCKCGTKFRCPWWNLREETLPALSGFKVFDRPEDLLGFEAVLPPKS